MHKYFLEFAYGRPGLKSPSTLEQLNLQLESLKTACSMNLQAVSINDIVGYILKLSTTCLPFFSLILLQWSWENSDTKICDCVTLCKAGQEGSSNCRLASSAPSHLGFHSQPTPPPTGQSGQRQSPHNSPTLGFPVSWKQGPSDPLALPPWPTHAPNSRPLAKLPLTLQHLSWL